MAVAFDSSFENYFPGHGFSPASFGSDVGNAQAGSVGANSNRALFAIVGVNATKATMGTVTATWDPAGTNQSMTLIDSVDVGTFGSVYLFGLKNPTSGSLDLSVAWTFSSAVDIAVGAISVYNVDQTTPWNNGGNNTGTGTSAASTVTSSSGDMAIAGHYNENATSTTINTGTSAWVEPNMNGNTAAGYNASAGASTNIAWTLGSSVNWANVKANAVQVGGGGGGAKKRMLAGLLAQRALRV